MFHKAHPVPRAIALTLAVLVMIPIANNWKSMFSSVHATIHEVVVELVENLE